MEPLTSASSARPSGPSGPSGTPPHDRRRCRRGPVVFALLCASCAAVGCATPAPVTDGCIEQSDEVLREIISGRAEFCTPALAAWEREEARACGWVTRED